MCCPLMPKRPNSFWDDDFTVTTTDGMIAHLKEHEAKGHIIDDAIEALEKDRAENDDFMKKVEEGMCPACEDSGLCRNCEEVAKPQGKETCGIGNCDGRCWDCGGKASTADPTKPD